MKPTKQQAISLKLAQWLGNKGAMIEHGEVYINDFTGRPFNPFASTTEGRAQFAECVEKAFRECPNLAMCYGRISVGVRGKIDMAFDFSAEPSRARSMILEAIYYAIGGVREWGE